MTDTRAALLFAGTFAVVAMAHASGPSLQPTPAASLSFSCSTFPSGATEADLVAKFARNNVTTALVPWGGAEGESNEGTVLFSGTPDAKVQIYWRDRAGRRQPEWVSVFGAASRWPTRGGISLGTSLTTIEKLNERPFRLLGFANDVEGTVMTWSGGKLESQDSPDCRVRVRLRPESVSATLPLEQLQQVQGERELPSDDAAMRALNPTVYELFLQYQR